MKMDHVAMVTGNIEEMKRFYSENFHARRVIRWSDETVLLYFIEFDNRVMLELEQRKNPQRISYDRENTVGIAHISMRVDTREELEEITRTLQEKGVPMRSGPTDFNGDFYESSFWDPDGNVVEISVDYDYLQALKACGKREDFA